MVKRSDSGKEYPSCLFHLAVICIIMGAKLTEHKQPSFTNMIKLASEQWDVDVDRKSLV
jgi:hypothetical protein